jgi:hypothetical protein
MSSLFSKSLILLFAMAALGCTLSYSALGQQNGYKSQEISEDDGIPVLLKHLPDWENVRSQAVFIQDKNALNNAVGNHPILNSVEFSGGTEAVSAAYPAGKLLIIEYTTPQAAADANSKFKGEIEQPGNLNISNGEPLSVEYRRVGNYSVFVFHSGDPTAAAALIDQVKYEKHVQWLGEDPFLLQKLERYFAETGRDVAISTVLWIALIFAITIATGIAAGFMYFRYRESQRAGMTAFTDAGGMTRLNLDDLSEPLP